MDEISAKSYEFNSSKEDPLFLNSLIYKYVKVQVLKDIVYTGYLESIDPLQYSVILNVSQGDEYKKIFIPGHALLNITVLEGFECMKPKNEVKLSLEDILEKKEKMISWFMKNLLPVTEEGDNIVVGNITILPPYSERDICASNPVVATGVRKMIINMP